MPNRPAVSEVHPADGLLDAPVPFPAHPVGEEVGRLARVHDLTHVGTRVAQPEDRVGLVEQLQHSGRLVVQERVAPADRTVRLDGEVDERLDGLLPTAGCERCERVLGAWVVDQLIGAEVEGQLGRQPRRALPDLLDELGTTLRIAQHSELVVDAQAAQLTPCGALVVGRAVGDAEEHADGPRRGLRADLGAACVGLGDDLEHLAVALGRLTLLHEPEGHRTARLDAHIGHPRQLTHDGRMARVLVAERIGRRLEHTLASASQHVGDGEQLVLTGVGAGNLAAVGDPVLGRARGREAQRTCDDRLVHQPRTSQRCRRGSRWPGPRRGCARP